MQPSQNNLARAMPAPESDAPCPECGGSLAFAVEDASLLVRCAGCDWSAATSNANHPVFDPTRYAVFVSEPLPDRLGLIYTLVSELGFRTIDACALLDNGRPLTTDACATEVRRLGRRLARHGITLATEPPFPWPW